MFSIGDWVQATAAIEEENFGGESLWTHALPGALGTIRDLDVEWMNVTWQATGTTTVCHLSELRWVCSVNSDPRSVIVIGNLDTARS